MAHAVIELRKARAATRLNNDADTNASQVLRNGKSRKPLPQCTRAACLATAQRSRSRERSRKLIQAFASKGPASAAGITERASESWTRHPGGRFDTGRTEACAAPFATSGWRVAVSLRPSPEPCRAAVRRPSLPSASRSRPGRRPGPRLVRYESIRPAELCESCAGIAPIVPSLAVFSKV